MKQIEVLGVSLKDYTLREAMKKVDVFLKDGKVSTIAYITTTGLMNAKDSDSIRNFLENVDLTIAADSDILKAAEIVNRNRIREVDNDEFLQEFLKKLMRGKRSIYLLTSTRDQLETLKEVLASYQSHMNVIGEYALEDLIGQDYDEDYLINDINVKTPNVIISNISSPQREQFFETNHMKLNADVWLMLKDEVVHKKLSRGVKERIYGFIVKKWFAREVSQYNNNK